MDKTKVKEKSNDFKIYMDIFLKNILFLILCLFLSFYISYINLKNLKKEIEANIVNIVIENTKEKEEIKNIDLEYEIKEILEKYKEDINAKNSDKVSEKISKLKTKYGIEDSYLEDDNIYFNSLKKEGLLKGLIILAIYSIYIYLIYKKEKNILNDIKNVKEILANETDFEKDKKTFFSVLDFKEGLKSKEKNEIYKLVKNLNKTKMNLEDANGKVEEFISDISHQIRVPISGIMLDTFSLKKDLKTKNINTNEVVKIEKNAEKISFLIEELLKMARIESKSIIYKKENIIFEDFISQIIEKFKYILELKNISVDIKSSEKEFIADEKWTMEAVGNIIKNAIEHTEENKKINISFYKSPFYNRIEIRDEGEGLEKEEIKKIFKRFYKGKNSSDKSVGIGLNISKKIIEAQGGFISVSSKKNEGTTFVINLLKQ